MSSDAEASEAQFVHLQPEPSDDEQSDVEPVESPEVKTPAHLESKCSTEDAMTAALCRKMDIDVPEETVDTKKIVLIKAKTKCPVGPKGRDDTLPEQSGLSDMSADQISDLYGIADMSILSGNSRDSGWGKSMALIERISVRKDALRIAEVIGKISSNFEFFRQLAEEVDES